MSVTESTVITAPRLLRAPQLALFVSNWPTEVDDKLQGVLSALLNDNLLALKAIGAGQVLTRPEEAVVGTGGRPDQDAKPGQLVQVQGNAHFQLTLPEFDGRITMKALEAWIAACAVGVVRIADVKGPTFLIVEPTVDGKTATLAWEFTEVCPATSGFQQVSFIRNPDQRPTELDSDAVVYEVNMLGNLNLNFADVLARAQTTLDAYNNPTSEA